MMPRGSKAPRRIVLVGMMGSGKSTVGRLLAAHTGWDYIDNDVAVRTLTEREPAELISTAGEAALHAAEATALLHALEGHGPLIIGAAAGVIEDPDCAAALEREDHVVYLRATPETLHERIGPGEGRRHDATDAAWLSTKVAERDGRYRAQAALSVDVDDGTPEEIVAHIARHFGL
jgi:shikimate kinase